MLLLNFQQIFRWRNSIFLFEESSEICRRVIAHPYVKTAYLNIWLSIHNPAETAIIKINYLMRKAAVSRPRTKNIILTSGRDGTNRPFKTPAASGDIVSFWRMSRKGNTGKNMSRVHGTARRWK